MSRRNYSTSFGKIRETKLKARESLYQDISAGGIRMVNFEVMIKALR